MHISESFQVLLKQENNILEAFSPEEFKHVRKRMINCILATDMANHVSHFNALKAKLELSDIKNGKNIEKILDNNDKVKKFENQQTILNWVIHTSDVSNPAKPSNVYDEWIDRVLVEFFNQGDEERNAGLPITYLCDRNTVDRNNSQIGFIKFVVSPTFEVLLNIIPEIQPYHNRILENLKIFEERDKEKKSKTS